MKVFLTGGSGFVGRYVLEELVRKGHAVRTLVHKNNVPPSLLKPGVETVPGDVTEPESLRGKMDGCEAVIHLTGILFEFGKYTFDRVNYEGARHTVDEALRAGIGRFVHMSSLGAKSTAPRRYNVSKAMGEEPVVHAPIAQTIIRPSVIFGPGDHQSRPLMNLIRFSPVIPDLRSPYGKIQPVSVREVAHCCVASLDDVKTQYQDYDLGGPRVFTWPELMREYARILGKKRWIAPLPANLLVAPSKLIGQVPGVPLTEDQMIMLQEDLTCDTTKTQAAFGVPKQTFEEITREILNSQKVA